MDALLKHMVNLTGHRDHGMLDLSVLSALQELAGARQTRVLQLATIGGQLQVRVRASIGASGPACLVEPVTAPGAPITADPALMACLASHQASAEMPDAAGKRTLWLPIWVGDTAATCLEIVEPRPYTGATMQVIDAIVAVYRNFQNLLDYSERDSLTGLLNRKTFEFQLARMLQARQAPPAAPLPPALGQERRQASGAQAGASEQQWLAVVDVDHFKLVNDRFGHLYGDEVLILIANLMLSSFRADDRVFRFGGEEFVVLLRSTSLEHARRIIERFRGNVEAHHFPQVGRVTVSVGFVSIDAQQAPVIILGHADQALYYAKSHGRNRACHYDQLIEQGLLRAVPSNDTAEFF